MIGMLRWAAPLQFSLTQTTATLFAGGLGFLGGFLSSFGLFLWRKRVRRQALRQALYTELEIPAAVIERATEQDPDSFTGPFHGEIPTTVYESQAVDLGLLASEEVEPLISYYSTATVAKEQLQSLDDEPIAERFFTETAPILKRKRERAAAAIEKRL